MKKYYLAIAATTICFVLGISFVALWFYRSTIDKPAASTIKESISVPRANESDAKNNSTDCCPCAKKRDFDDLKEQSKKIRMGMTKQEVEQVLGKPDYTGMQTDNNVYCYCTNKMNFGVPVPLVIKINQNNEVVNVSFFEVTD